MHQRSGTSTGGVNGVSATTMSVFTIFSRLQGVCSRILEVIATDHGTPKCRRQPEKWDGSIGGSCVVLPWKLQKTNKAVGMRLLILGDRVEDPSEELLKENEFFLREEKREQESRMTMRLQQQIILVGINPDDRDERQYPLKLIRAIANRIVGQIVHERINNSLVAESLSRHRHPPPQKDSHVQMYRRPPSGFTRTAHQQIIQQAMRNSHILRPPLKGGVHVRQ